MAKYRKFFAALVGMGALVAFHHLDVRVPGFESVVMDLVVGALTAWGVYQVPNSEG